jgi:tetratricopeptide (TPR) repeat protein
MDPLAVIGLCVVLTLGLVGGLILSIITRKKRDAQKRSLELQKYQKYLQTLDQMILLNPSNAKTYWQKGQIYEAMGKREEALPLYQMANTLSPNISPSGDFVENFDLPQQKSKSNSN